jgi:hypothetical protein
MHSWRKADDQQARFFVSERRHRTRVIDRVRALNVVQERAKAWTKPAVGVEQHELLACWTDGRQKV